MRKLWTLVWKDLYITYTDRNLILIMIATPLVLATIISLAFSNLGGGDVPVSDIPVAVVNLDEGSGFGPPYGDIIVSALVPPDDDDTATDADAPTCDLIVGSDDDGNDVTLFDLTDAELLDSADAARAGVDAGDYVAAIIISADFSRRVEYIPVTHPEIEATAIEVYANSGNPLSASIIRSIAEGFANQIATGNITVAATLEQLEERVGLVQLGLNSATFDFGSAFACAFAPGFNPIDIDQQTIEGQSSSSINALVFFGSAQAMFFMLFTAQGTAGSMIEEQRQWTLQRLHVSPTPRIVILVGKLLATLVIVVVQFAVLAIALMLVGSLLSGEFVAIWGTNIPGIVAVVLVAGLSVSGVGAIIASAIQTPEQAQVVGSVVNLAIAGLGGSFGFQVPESLQRFSLIFWGTDAFEKLSQGGGDIGLNLLILAVQGGVMFVIGLYIFKRRLAE
ncbi:MAG: ABC transporter permease [Chloroflexi bacterium]|nr:MAG: ABC transporter permease [Chloroflexota bacterium]